MIADVEQPDISVIVPTYNEQGSIEACLDSLIQASYEGGNFEIIVVDGRSEDETRQIVNEYASNHDAISLLDNPDQTTPHAMNIGMDESTGDVVVFISGHSTVPTDFFEQIVEAFEVAPDAGVVGGQMVPEPTSYFQTAVAGALISRFGSSSSRFQSIEGYVETVNFGAYRRNVIETVGEMNTALPRAQDYEYNRRVRNQGFKIYQYPSLKISYYPRSTPDSLARQYYGNGVWKTIVFRLQGDFPTKPKVCGATAILAGFLMSPLLVFAVIPIYLLVLFVTAVQASRSNTIPALKPAHVPFVIFSLLIMHISFGLGLLVGSLKSPMPVEKPED